MQGGSVDGTCKHGVSVEAQRLQIALGCVEAQRLQCWDENLMQCCAHDFRILDPQLDWFVDWFSVHPRTASRLTSTSSRGAWFAAVV